MPEPGQIGRLAMGCHAPATSGGAEMTDRPLYRQIHPSWIRNGGVTSMAFLPTSKDRKRLSVYDGDMIAAKSAWMHYSNTLGNKSAGVMAVTETECRSRNLSITPDPEQYGARANRLWHPCPKGRQGGRMLPCQGSPHARPELPSGRRQRARLGSRPNAQASATGKPPALALPN